jgi:hypothetical protein
VKSWTPNKRTNHKSNKICPPIKKSPKTEEREQQKHTWKIVGSDSMTKMSKLPIKEEQKLSRQKHQPLILQISLGAVLQYKKKTRRHNF